MASTTSCTTTSTADLCHRAAANANENVLAALIDCAGVDVDRRDADGVRPIHYAANANAEGGRSLGHVAAVNPNAAVMQCLVERGIDVNARNNRGKTALDAGVGAQRDPVECICAARVIGTNALRVDARDDNQAFQEVKNTKTRRGEVDGLTHSIQVNHTKHQRVTLCGTDSQ